MSELLGPTQIRELAERLGVRPPRTFGQNFVQDLHQPDKVVLEAG